MLRGRAQRKDDHERIAARAYALYEKQGYRQGRELQDWLVGVREILIQRLSV